MTGTVGYDDPNKNVVGVVVSFGGVLASYHLSTTVTREDGVFTLAVHLPGLQEGTATAQGRDSNNHISEIAEYPIYIW